MRAIARHIDGHRPRAATRVLGAACLALALGFTSAAARGQAVSDSDQGAIHALIAGQIAAFQRDDAAAAYAAASPGIQSVFPDRAQFMAMVSGSYGPIYRAKSVVFGSLTQTADGPLQQVFLVGPDGLGYVARYLMERKGDGTWRVNGVALARNDQPPI